MIAKTFVHQLHTILAEPSLSELIGWADSEREDDSFFLRPYQSTFPDLVLKKYFKHGNVSSFVRQLHMYGFHKLPNTATNRSIQNVLAKHNPETGRIPKSEIIWYFVHPSGYFTKNANKELLNKIQRKTTGVGKDGRRRNILSPVCVNFIDSNGSALYNPQIDMYQPQVYPNIVNGIMEVNMTNQMNMMNRPYERSVSCINIPVNRMRTPVTRTNSQPVIRLRNPSLSTIGEQLPNNNGQRLSYSSVDSNTTYYNNPTSTTNTLLNHNGNNPQYHLQHQPNMPLPPPSSFPGVSQIQQGMMPYPYMNSITPPPVGAITAGYSGQQQAQQQQQPMFKQSVFNNVDQSPLTVDESTTPKISRPPSAAVSAGGTQIVDPLARSDVNGGAGGAAVMMSTMAPTVLPAPAPTLPSLNQINTGVNDEIYSTQNGQWNQPRVTPISSNTDITNPANIKQENTTLPKISTSSTTVATDVSSKGGPIQPIASILNNNGTTSVQEGDGTMKEYLEVNLQNLVKSIVLITDILDKVHLSEDSTLKESVNSSEISSKTKEIEIRKLPMDKLLNMLSELRTKLINNNDIIARTLNTEKENKSLTPVEH